MGASRVGGGEILPAVQAQAPLALSPPNHAAHYYIIGGLHRGCERARQVKLREDIVPALASRKPTRWVEARAGAERIPGGLRAGSRGRKCGPARRGFWKATAHFGSTRAVFSRPGLRARI